MDSKKYFESVQKYLSNAQIESRYNITTSLNYQKYVVCDGIQVHARSPYCLIQNDDNCAWQSSELTYAFLKFDMKHRLSVNGIYIRTYTTKYCAELLKFKLQGSNDDKKYHDIIIVEDTGFSTTKLEFIQKFQPVTYRYYMIQQSETPDSSSHPTWQDIGIRKLDFFYITTQTYVSQFVYKYIFIPVIICI